MVGIEVIADEGKKAFEQGTGRRNTYLLNMSVNISSSASAAAIFCADVGPCCPNPMKDILDRLCCCLSMVERMIFKLQLIRLINSEAIENGELVVK
jgi:hypothetical protein